MCQVKKEINNTLVNTILFVVQLSNERRPQISAALQRKKISKRHGAYIRVNTIRFAMNPVLRTHPFMARNAFERLVLKRIFMISNCFPDRSSHPVCPNDRQEIEEEGGVST